MLDLSVVIAGSSVVAAIAAASTVIGKMLMTIRHNDLKHIDARLDTIDKNIQKLDDRMAHHITWHIRDKFPRSAE